MNHWTDGNGRDIHNYVMGFWMIFRPTKIRRITYRRLRRDLSYLGNRPFRRDPLL